VQIQLNLTKAEKAPLADFPTSSSSGSPGAFNRDQQLADIGPFTIVSM
jgi:hypothetical protein